MPNQPLRLGFDTDLTIRNAAAVKAMLAEGLGSSRELCLAINPDAAVDLSFVQMVVAARLRARNSGGELTLAEPAGLTLRNVLSRSGFIDGGAAADLKFWLHSENA